MRAFTEYKIGHKPLGGWRIPLWFRFGVESEPELAFYCNWMLPSLIVPKTDELSVYSSGPRVCDQNPLYGMGLDVRTLRREDGSMITKADFRLIFRQGSREIDRLGDPEIEYTFYCLHREALGWMVSHLENTIYPYLVNKVDEWISLNAELPEQELVVLPREPRLDAKRLVISSGGR